MITVSVCLPSDALLQHLPFYLGFSYLGHGVSHHGCSSKVQTLLLTLDKGYLFTATPPDLECGMAPLGPPTPGQPPFLGHGISRHGYSSKEQPLLLTLDEGYLLAAAPLDLERGIAPLGPLVPPQPPLLGCGVAPPGRCPWPRAGVALLGSSCAVSAWYSRPPPLTLDAG